MNFKDLTGQRFGKLNVLKYLGKSKWLCKCDCGEVTTVRGEGLKTGNTKSCGCIRKENSKAIGENNRKYKKLQYNDDFKKLYGVWIGLKRRCLNTSYEKYKNYGARGITLCKQWLDFNNFYKWAINNGYRRGLSIDRINNSKGYKPSNCRWANNLIQQRNRRNSKMLTFENRTLCITEWAEIFNINISTLRGRLRNNWTTEKALTTEVL